MRSLVAVCLGVPFAACGGETISGAPNDAGAGAAGGASSSVEAGTGGIKISSGGRAAGGAAVSDGPWIPPDTSTGGNVLDGAISPGADASDSGPPFDCTDPEPGPLPPLPSPEAFRPFVAAYCGMLERCFPHYYPSGMDCEDFFSCSSRVALRLPQVDSFLAACTATMLAMTDCPLQPSGPPCSPYAGTAKEHESCQTATCAAGLHCRYGDAGTCPVCERPVARGATCTPFDTCERDHFCSPTSSKCEPFRRPSEPCTEHYQCAAGPCANGACRALVGENDPCPSGLECGTGLACKAGVCAATFALPGSPCGPQSPCLGGVCENGLCVAHCVNGEMRSGYCASSAACSADERCEAMTSRCVPRLQNGAPCKPGSDECFTGSYCDPTTGCTPLRPLGAPCLGGAQCASNYCPRDRCAPKCSCTMP